ncbi:hypothetical protein [Marinospirillum alkaliphilum]|uniref:Uncharacterized protein n=1 Tax=Marinospirillum alkaliphilum DSM 21637 TaxID=1122209 RepID=A0A1K1ZIG4_9GAMM|nr:hypothetical protein [Marinospirillum alkaliphilum]SFX73484.1 hypothetical protein SAMN02745752_02701 [Marinospirillum alkaliphilum DSM 21637]
MASELVFRLDQTRRFLTAILSSKEGRHFLVYHLLNTLMLALLVLAALSLLLFGLFEGMILKRRTLVLTFGMLTTLLVVVPMATMPFFSFKDVVHRCVSFFNRRGLFTHLSEHVFYRRTAGGHINLHLAKAHAVLAEKHRLVLKKAEGNVSRQLAFSLSRSIRDAVRISKEQVQNGSLRTDQKIIGATYGYLFGAAKSKLRLQRHQPGWISRCTNGVFYRFGALHAVFMYFIIHEKLPPSFDPVYFMATVGDVVGSKGINPV